MEYQSFGSEIVNSLKNPQLRSAICAMLYSESKRNLDGFLRVFLTSYLLVLTEHAPRQVNGEIVKIDEEGFGYYGIGTKIPLVQLENEKKEKILPAFTECDKVQIVPGLTSYHGVVVESCSLLEMALAAGSSILSINPGSENEFNLERSSVIELVDQLKLQNILPSNLSVRRD